MQNNLNETMLSLSKNERTQQNKKQSKMKQQNNLYKKKERS